MRRTIKVIRTILAGLLELAGFGLLIYAGILLAPWLGFALAGVIAIGVAVWLSPPDTAPNDQHDQHDQHDQPGTGM